jgi:hypothetical protein
LPFCRVGLLIQGLEVHVENHNWLESDVDLLFNKMARQRFLWCTDGLKNLRSIERWRDVKKSFFPVGIFVDNEGGFTFLWREEILY